MNPELNTTIPEQRASVRLRIEPTCAAVVASAARPSAAARSQATLTTRREPAAGKEST